MLALSGFIHQFNKNLYSKTSYNCVNIFNGFIFFDSKYYSLKLKATHDIIGCSTTSKVASPGEYKVWFEGDL